MVDTQTCGQQVPANVWEKKYPGYVLWERKTFMYAPNEINGLQTRTNIRSNTNGCSYEKHVLRERHLETAPSVVLCQRATWRMGSDKQTDVRTDVFRMCGRIVPLAQEKRTRHQLGKKKERYVSIPTIVQQIARVPHPTLTPGVKRLRPMLTVADPPKVCSGKMCDTGGIVYLQHQ